jgi:malate synthase
MLDEELRILGPDYTAGRDLFEEITLTDDYVDFLTLPAYERMPRPPAEM